MVSYGSLRAEFMDEKIRLIQSCLVLMVKDIDRVCRENGIHYSLCGGSVIGMHLYGGFIPWDDDIDLMMTRRNYDRFLAIYPKKCDPRYHLRHYTTDGTQNLPALFARVEDTRTIMEEEIAGARRSGRVFIDITVFDPVPGPVAFRLARLYAGAVYTILYRKNGMTPGTGWKRQLLNLIPMPASEEETRRVYAGLERTLRRLVRTRRDSGTAELLSAAFSGYLYDARIFDHYINCRFEGLKLMVVRDYMDYLYARYKRRVFTMDVSPEDRQKEHILSVRILPEKEQR